MTAKEKESSNTIDLPFIPEYRTLQEVLNDSRLATLGDAYVNFVYSLAQSWKKELASGKKVGNKILATALRKAGLRGFLPGRSDRHQQANAAEALIVYAWVRKAMSLLEIVDTLRSVEGDVEGFTALLQAARSRLKL